MKKVLTILITVLLVCTLPASFASAEGGNAEIQFCVGDSVLTINGVPVMVETPYVVGAGVTLVPVRVITEAFGAKVGWDGDTKTITIDYPGSNIILQIGNISVYVNGAESALLAAPELSSGGYTMVPLRFISETFGASVSYDDATKKITILKGTPAADGAGYYIEEPSEGFKRFTAKNLGISFLIPDDMDIDTDEITENSYYFSKTSPDDTITGISIVAYTKGSDSAYAVANEDFNYNKQVINQDITQFDNEVQRRIYGTLITYSYNYLINAAYFSEKDTDVFFEHGDYLYNLTFYFKLPKDNMDNIISSILSSIEVGNINPAAFGTVYRQSKTTVPRRNTSKLGCSMLVPTIYSEEQGGGRVYLKNTEDGVGITMWRDFNNNGYSLEYMKKVAEETKNRHIIEEGATLYSDLEEVVINKHTAYKFTVFTDNKAAGYRTYNENYYIMKDESIGFYCFSVGYTELAYSEGRRSEVKSILDTISFE